MKNEKLYTNYETELTMTKKDWFLYYLTEIDKTEYTTFVDWWADMERMDLLTEVA